MATAYRLLELQQRRFIVEEKNDRVDPTRTATLRRAFEQDMGRRFRELRGIVRKALVNDDVFGLKVYAMRSPGYKAFDFPRSADKVEAFMEWFNEQVEAGILTLVVSEQLGVATEEPWTNKYVWSAYKQGVWRARTELHKAGYEVPPPISREAITAAILTTPVHMDAVGLIYTRTYSALKGITAAMDRQISEVLAIGLADGKGPYRIARELTRTISGPLGDLGITDILGRFIPAERRARMLARTEIIRAHHLAMMQEYENWGIVGVTVKAEWKTAGDGRVCSICRSLEGKVFELKKIKNMIPRHPQCRCVALPVVKE